jgi:hypothetical protein
MSMSEHFRYRNDVFQSDIFLSDIGITDVDVGCRISPTLRSMSMPTYAVNPVKNMLRFQKELATPTNLLVEAEGIYYLATL